MLCQNMGSVSQIQIRYDCRIIYNFLAVPSWSIDRVHLPSWSFRSQDIKGSVSKGDRIQGLTSSCNNVLGPRSDLYPRTFEQLVTKSVK
jgi:hypothetical protein